MDNQTEIIEESLTSKTTIAEIQQVSKNFDKKMVLSKITFSLQTPGIYALLGRNGSGKTTLMNLLTCRYFPSSGSIKLFGEEPFDNQAVLSKVCFMQDQLFGFQQISIHRILEFAKSFYPNWSDELMERCLTLFHLDMDETYSNLSKGMQSAVSITLALSSRTELTLLDEIHTGLDASIRQEFYQLLLNDYIEHPRTYLISTHLIDEMESLFSHVLILNDHAIVLDSPLEDIKERAFECTGNETVAYLLSKKHQLSSKKFLSSYRIVLFDSLLKEEQQQIINLGGTVRALSLQEFFIALTKEQGEKERS